MIPGLTDLEPLYRGPRTRVYRATRTDDGRSVIVKTLVDDDPSAAGRARLRLEHELLRALDDPGVVRPLELVEHGRTLALVLEDIGGRPLIAAVPVGALDIARFLELALEMTAIVGRLHRHGLIHKDINPSNFVLNPESGQLQLVDLDLATRLSYERENDADVDDLEGTLPYLAPEQTGRMSRPVDWRADLYALGATFYELLTGRPPFVSSAPLELIYLHLAVTPEPPAVRRRDVPNALSAVVMKLLAKSPRDRYQGAFGLRADLERCRRALEIDGVIAPFPLGEHDVPDRFHIPERLYGREDELARLLRAFEQVGEARAALVLVRGQPGSGKTALVSELQQPLVERRGRLIRGKYEQLQRNVPYSALAQAFGALVRRILAEPEPEVDGWCQRLEAALGESGQVVVDVVPELGLLLGPQPDVPPLSGREARNRLNVLFRRFVGVLATPERPLVLFVDDLHWADLGSLELLGHLLTDEQLADLLIVGAYRENEVYPGHPLLTLLETVRSGGAPVDELTLGPLEPDDVTALVADAVHVPPEDARPLATVVHDKTAGNPFFVRQFLTALAAEEHLQFDTEAGRWTWQLDAVRALDITDNVVGFLMRRLLALAAEAREALRLAACVGDRSDLATLAAVADRPPAQLARQLVGPLAEGHLLALGTAWQRYLSGAGADEALDAADVIFRFAHDRVRQAAYSLVPDEDKPALHLRIGRVLEQRTADEQAVFDIVHHLNLGAELLRADDERVALAELNLRAGRLAMAAAAYETARDLLDRGLSQLGADAWSVHPALTRALHEEAAAAAYAAQDLAAAHANVDVVLDNVVAPEARAPAQLTRIETLIAERRLPEAAAAGRRALAELAVTVPENATDEAVGARFEQTAALLAERGLEALRALPEMTDPRVRAAMRLGNVSAVSMSFADSRGYVLLVLEMVRLTVEHGVAPGSGFALANYAAVCASMGQYEAAARYGQLGVELTERLDARAMLPRVLVTYETSVRHWTAPQADSIAPLRRGLDVGLEVGDFNFAMLCAVNHCTQMLQAGWPLERVEARMSEVDRRLARFRSHSHLNALHIHRQAVANLTGQADDPLRLVGDHFDAGTMRPQLEAANDTTHLVQIDMCRAMLAAIFGRDDRAAALAMSALTKVADTGWRGTMYLPLTHYHAALGILGSRDEVADDERARLDAALETSRAVLARVAERAPTNYAHKLALVDAEQARVDGRVADAMARYDRAIEGARANGYLQDEAMAGERAARFYRALGRTRIAALYLRAAHAAWLSWGATAKVEALSTAYPGQLMAAESTADRTDVDDVHTASLRMGGAALDLAAVLKASQAISEEIEREALLATLMGVTAEHAGASSGALVDLRAEPPHVTVSWRHGHDPQLLPNVPLEESDQLSARVVRYVQRTREPVVLGDAATDERFAADPHLTASGARSVLCLPVARRGELRALLYLESSVAAGVFTPNRLEVLRMLSAQIAISLENAELYHDLAALSEAYARFVPQGMLGLLERGSVVDVGLGDQVQRRLTVLFADVRGFTRRAEAQSPAETFALLNDYLGRMVPVIQANGGVVDKYVGDSIMALFPGHDGADRALRAAIDMLRARDLLNADLASAGQPPLAMGIGLHSGPVMLGTVGSADRMDATVIGDTVNLASRIEGVTKQYGVALALSRATYEALEFPRNYLQREIDRVRVVGREASVGVYEVFEADPPERVARKRESMSHVAEVVAAYRAGDLDRCEEACRMVRLLDPDDEVAERYLRRCAAVRRHDLPPDELPATVLREK